MKTLIFSRSHKVLFIFEIQPFLILYIDHSLITDVLIDNFCKKTKLTLLLVFIYIFESINSNNKLVYKKGCKTMTNLRVCMSQSIQK